MERSVGNRRWFVLGGLTFYAACLLITAPASMTAWIIARASDGMVLLERPEGSMWRGRASRLLVSIPGGGAMSIGNSTWDVALLRLFRGELAIDLALDGVVNGSGTLILQPGKVRVTGSRITLPASVFVSFFPVLQFIRPGGQLAIDIADVVFSANRITGAGEALWMDATSALSPLAPLGSYRARVESDQQHARLEITTMRGALQVEGRGAWSSAAGVSFEGLARAAPGEAPRLRDLLQLMGRDDGNGNHRLRYVAPP